MLCCALPPLSPWVTGLMHSYCYGGGWQRVNKKQENVWKHGISIENIAHDFPKNTSHLNSYNARSFQKKWSEIAHAWFFKPDFQNSSHYSARQSMFLLNKDVKFNFKFHQPGREKYKAFPIEDRRNCLLSHWWFGCSVTRSLNSACEQIFSCNDLMKRPNDAIAR